MTENSYASMLAELRRRRDVLTAELKGVNSAIDAITPLAGGESPSPTAASLVIQMPPGNLAVSGQAVSAVARLGHSDVGNYSRLSVRWSALWHLAEFARGPMRNGEIADAITAGGYHSGAGSFPNAVSAVLSGMRAKGEIDGTPDVGYYLTPKGKDIWQSIRGSERFRSIMAHSSSTSEPSLLSVQ